MIFDFIICNPNTEVFSILTQKSRCGSQVPPRGSWSLLEPCPRHVTHQAPGSGIDGGEGEVGTLHLPYSTGVQPVVGGHSTIYPHIGAWSGQYQGLQ